MSIDIAQLEQAWLRAETVADEAKRDLISASEVLHERNGKIVDAAEVRILMASVEEAKSRQAKADRDAIAAFDLLWQAKGQGQQTVHA